MKQPRAALEIGEVLGGAGGPRRVEGYIQFKEWDQEDGGDAYWEEWRLSGPGGEVVWVEVDHYDNEVHLYRPAHFAETIEPSALTVGQVFTLTKGDRVYAARVTLIGSGKVVGVLGDPGCPLREGKEMGYYELELTDAHGTVTSVTLDSHGFEDLEAFWKERLTRSGQRAVLGKVVARERPGRPTAYSARSAHSAYPSAAARSAGGSSASGSSEINRFIVMTIFWVLVIAEVLWALFSCDDDGNGDNGSSGTNDDNGSSGTNGGGWRRRRSVYGGGGGGTGK